MIKSKLFENEAQLNEFFNSCIKQSIISIETVTVEVFGRGRNEDRLKLWYNTPEQEACPIPREAHSLEVFAIKDSESSYTGKEAYIGYKMANGDFHFVHVPYTEPFKSKEPYYIYEVEPRHQYKPNGIVLGPFTSPEQASEAAVKWGYVGENYFISPTEIK